MQRNSCAGVSDSFAECNEDAQGWRQVLQSSYGDTDLPLLQGEDCKSATFHKGVIDCKGGFEVTEDFSSTQIPRLYAAGTTGSHWTGDTYIAPGATIGLAMYSGHKISQTAIQRLNIFEEQLKPDRYEEDDSRVPGLFLSATWLLFVAVAAHVAGSSLQIPWLFYVHYALAATAVLLFTIAIATAAASGMAPKQHRTVGYIAYGILVAQVVGGSILAWSWASPGSGLSETKESWVDLPTVHLE